MTDETKASVRIGCQTITWGEGQRERFPEVFAEIASSRYEGVEIGFRHFRDTSPASMKEMLGTNGLVLFATHLGGNLEDATQANAERNVLDDALDYVRSLNCNTLIYSGLKFVDEAQFEADLARLNRSAARCHERGARLLYHNHNWEFADDGRVIDAILSRTDPALGLCPDVGWVAKAGVDVLAFLERAKDRIVALHFKDFGGPGSTVDTVVLGEGIAPLSASATWMRENLPAGSWAIAEQDRSNLPPNEAADRNARYLRGLFQ